MRRLIVLLGCGVLWAAPAAAQLQSQVVVRGLSLPVAFVQDPSLADTQYVVEQGGRIRVVRAGQLSTTDFLDLTGLISSGGERGLLGFAFAPDYPTSGRFFVNFTNPAGDTVVARFRRSSGDPRRADASSRFDFRWPDGNRFISQPYANHNGGNLQFGSDGYLYIGLGDGGSGDDPENRAQTPSTLLGKMLRININVADSDPEGYDVPADNPFIGVSSYLAEIWDIGLRNPWRYTFDAFGAGATGALIIGDVGQGRYEEVDYEPARAGGRNYGWRIREGAHDEVTSLPAAFLPLRDPIAEYDHSVGQTVIGGYVYRGAALSSFYRGRYFFADFIMARVWSIPLAIDSNGEATAGAVQEHTSELGGANALGNISSFGIDESGELYLVGYSAGEIRRITSASSPTAPAMAVDTPGNGTTVVQNLAVGGWAIDQGSTSGTGVDAVHLWAFPVDGGTPFFVAAAAYGGTRGDVGTVYGSRFAGSGYNAIVTNLPPRTYDLRISAHSTVTGTFNQERVVRVTVSGPVSDPWMAIDTPLAGSTVTPSFAVAGWAIDRGAPSGPGVDAVHVWAFPLNADGSLGTALFLGAASYGGSRPDVGSVFGAQFTNSSYRVQTAPLSSGRYRLVAYAHSAITNTFNDSRSIDIVVAGPAMAVDAPLNNAMITGTFIVGGWAIDAAATSGTGVDAVHIWAVPTAATGGLPVFVAAATYGAPRGDVGAAFGSQFTNSGYNTYVSGLTTGTYDLVVYARSTVTGTFNQSHVVRVTVQ